MKLTLIDILSLSPLLILLGGALFVLLLETFFEKAARRFSMALTTFTFVWAIYAEHVAPISENTLLTPWIRFDSMSHLFTLFFLFVGLACTFLADAFFRRFQASRGEYYFFLLSSVFGLVLVASAADLLTLFLGLETLSISLYVLCGYIKAWPLSNESSAKYFLMGALGAAFLLYGIALIYGATGTTQIGALLAAYQKYPAQQALFLGGIAFITVGLSFKAALVPFHTWAPDVYDGAPTPVTAFMSVATKAGAFAAFSVLFLQALPHFNPVWNQAVTLLAYPTLLYANFVALRQMQLRRFFAYSGISHSGYLLIPLIAGTPDAFSALFFYLVVYALATLGAFAVISSLDQRSDGVMLTDLKGLFSRSPLWASVLILCLLTLAGIPPTAGFLAKFYLFKIAYEAHLYPLLGVALFVTILSAYYYLRIVAFILSEKEEQAAISKSRAAIFVGGLAAVSIITVSFYPILLSLR